MADLISDIVGRNIAEFVDFSLTIITIMIVWYIIKFFIVPPPTEEEKEARRQKDAESGKELREWIKEKAEKKKKELEEKEGIEEEAKEVDRDKLMKAALGFAVNAEKDADTALGFLDSKDDVSLSKARSKVNSCMKNLKNVMYEIRLAKSKTKGKHHMELAHLQHYASHFANEVKNKVIRNIPESINEEGSVQRIELVKKVLEEVVKYCGVLISKIMKFVDDASVSEEVHDLENSKGDVNEEVKEDVKEEVRKKVKGRVTGMKPVGVVKKK